MQTRSRTYIHTLFTCVILSARVWARMHVCIFHTRTERERETHVRAHTHTHYWMHVRTFACRALILRSRIHSSMPTRARTHTHTQMTFLSWFFMGSILGYLWICTKVHGDSSLMTLTRWYLQTMTHTRWWSHKDTHTHADTPCTTPSTWYRHLDAYMLMHAWWQQHNGTHMMTRTCLHPHDVNHIKPLT